MFIEAIVVRRLHVAAVLELDAPTAESIDQGDVMTRDEYRYADLVETPENAHYFER